MRCVDAGVLVEALIPEGRFTATARQVVAAGGLVAPELVDIEVMHVLGRMVHLGEVSGAIALESVKTLGAVSLTRRSHRPLLPRIWELRDNLSAYDAAYVALAESLSCPMFTVDARIAAAPGVRCEIVVLGD
ncbi:MAG: PilT protein domain protein [Aeromicrobium sp.]|nr:PilT protein domain protein [Aeromicrobium sp.]